MLIAAKMFSFVLFTLNSVYIFDTNSYDVTDIRILNLSHRFQKYLNVVNKATNVNKLRQI